MKDERKVFESTIAKAEGIIESVNADIAEGKITCLDEAVILQRKNEIGLAKLAIDDIDAIIAILASLRDAQ